MLQVAGLLDEPHGCIPYLWPCLLLLLNAAPGWTLNFIHCFLRLGLLQGHFTSPQVCLMYSDPVGLSPGGEGMSSAGVTINSRLHFPGPCSFLTLMVELKVNILIKARLMTP